MPNSEVMLAKLTRREFREGIEGGRYTAAVICVGSNEQHSEHLAMEHDMASVTAVAREAAKRLYPRVIVAAPVAVGISEHHMHHKGTLSAGAGSWLGVVFDAADSLARHGIQSILILNGHGGNTAPIRGVFESWRYRLKNSTPGVNLQFCSYWELIPKEILERHMETAIIPGHAKEFETSIGLALFPENVRKEIIPLLEDKDPMLATAEKGRIFFEEAVSQTAEYLKGMMDGRIGQPDLKHFP
ncbi:MAG: creatininase family protein [Desulfobacteraceae bacterium]|nr:MAG: creatininase family protein [Desulfobacteraceae bacterium]